MAEGLRSSELSSIPISDYFSYLDLILRTDAKERARLNFDVHSHPTFSHANLLSFLGKNDPFGNRVVSNGGLSLIVCPKLMDCGIGHICADSDGRGGNWLPTNVATQIA